MALEPGIGLVGRDDTAALIESLVDRRPRQTLPIVVAYGPGGSGKTALLDHISRRYPDAPLARVDLEKAGSRSCQDILDVISGQLRSYSHRQFGRLRLPRYALARLAVTTAAQPERDDENYRHLRDLVADRMTNLLATTNPSTASAEFVPPARRFGRLLRPLLRRLMSWSVIAPAPLRRVLAGRTFAAALRWYEQDAGQRVLGHDDRKINEVVLATWQLVRSREREHQVAVDKLLVAAFLADLRAAYRGDRHRRMNTVLLLDGADLLAGIDTYLPPRRPAAPSTTDFLDLLAQARVEHPDVPLLVVATKQAGQDVRDVLPGAHRSSGDPEKAAAELLTTWRARFDQALTRPGDYRDAYLPVRLRPFTAQQTRQFMVQWNRLRNATIESEAFVAELHEVTHGHPLAVRICTQVVESVLQRDQVLPAVRSVFTERLPVDEQTTYQEGTVGEYLLLRFLQRFPGSQDVPERTVATEVFGRLAAPRQLDLATIRLLAPEWGEDPRELLSTFSFVERAAGRDGAQFFVLHPLLRDLFAMRLREQDPKVEPSYWTVHQKLKDHYAKLGWQREMLYHALALNEVHLVAARLGPDIEAGELRWLTDLGAVAEAPMPPNPPAPGAAPRVRGLLDRLRRPTLDKLVSPAVSRVELAVMTTWQLRSCTSTVRRTPNLYDGVINSYQALHARGAVGVDSDLVRFNHLASYRRLKHATAEGIPAETPPELPRFSTAGDRHPYPRVWPGRHALRRTAVVGAVLLVLAYLVVFVAHGRQNCDRFGLLNPAGLVTSLTDDSLTLAKFDGGECIGVTDQAGDFSYKPADRLSDDDAEVAELSRLIADQNAQVADAVNQGERSYVTIVVATMLSTTAEPPARDLSAGVNELRGAYLAQQRWNEFGTASARPDPLLRVLLANFGGNSEHADATAAQIKEVAERDPSVVAVTGMGQTRVKTVSAAELLGGGTGNWPGLPIIGSVTSGDDFTGKAQFFRVAPPNRRQVEVAVGFAQHTLPARHSTPLRPFVVYDQSDPYSANLRDLYQAGWTGDPKPVDEPYEADASVNQVLHQRVDNICASTPPGQDPLVIYTGRTTQIPTLLDLLGLSTCGQHAVVLGSDDLTQLETAGFRDLAGREQYVDGKLFYTTFDDATPGAWRIIGPNGTVPPKVADFFDQYGRAQQQHGAAGDKAFRTPANGHIMLAYDAVQLVMDRVQGLPAADKRNRGALAAALRQTTGDHAYQGISGMIDFKVDRPLPAGGADPRQKLVVTEQVVLDGPKLTVAYADHDPR